MSYLNDEAKRHAQELDICLNNRARSDQIDEFRKAWEADMDSALLRFQYASVLAYSEDRDELREAQLHLEFLVNNTSAYMRDSLYLLIIVHYLLGNFDAARSCAEELLCIDPDNEQVRHLHLAISYKHEKQLEKEQRQQETQQAVAVGLGMAVAAAGLGLAFLLRKK